MEEAFEGVSGDRIRQVIEDTSRALDLVRGVKVSKHGLDRNGDLLQLIPEGQLRDAAKLALEEARLIGREEAFQFTLGEAAISDTPTIQTLRNRHFRGEQ